jgi:hypothetical protein
MCAYQIGRRLELGKLGGRFRTRFDWKAALGRTNDEQRFSTEAADRLWKSRTVSSVDGDRSQADAPANREGEKTLPHDEYDKCHVRAGKSPVICSLPGFSETIR